MTASEELNSIFVTDKRNESLHVDSSCGIYGQKQAFCEQWVDCQRLAEIMGISTRTISRFVVLGMPSTTWGLRARRFLPSQTIAWAERHAEVTR